MAVPRVHLPHRPCKPGVVMTPFVSTFGTRSGCDLLIQSSLGASVQGRVVGRAVLPAAPHDPHPGPCQDAHRVGMVLARGPRPVIDLSGPWAGQATVRGEGCQRYSE